MLPKENSTLHEIDVKKTDNNKKPSRFSLKWLLRRTREKSSPGEKGSCNNINKSTSNYTLLPKSKSCDPCMRAGIKNDVDVIKRSPTVPVPYLHLQRKISAAAAYGGPPSKVASSMFRTSYSSNDVQTLLSPTQSPAGSSTITRKNNYLGRSRDADLSSCAGPTSSCKSRCGSKQDLTGPAQCRGSVSRLSPESIPWVHSPTSDASHQLCRLCLMLVPPRDLYTLKQCACVFCLPCIQQYLTINIREGNVLLTCPDADCGKEGSIQVAEVEELVEREIFDMFQRFKQCREVELDPTRTWCPGVDCETVCYVRTPSDPNKGMSVQCPKCRLKFCSLCKERWHSIRTCEDVRRDRQEEEVLLLEQEDESPSQHNSSSSRRQQPSIKRCPNPNCRVPIERDEGCAQMMCKRCKHVFCWYCLTSLDDDLLLRHYDKGPCKNKLGHSRASVVWHRTQVVGVLAGFGFLLLVASPLLLIAAPCLLCCRCKQCTRFFDEEPTTV